MAPQRGQAPRPPAPTNAELGSRLAHAGCHQFGERILLHRSGAFHALFRGAALAQVQGRDLFVHDLGEVNHRFALMALIAAHQGINSTLESGTSRPLSMLSTRSARQASIRLWVTTTSAVSNSRASAREQLVQQLAVPVVETALVVVTRNRMLAGRADRVLSMESGGWSHSPAWS